MPSFGSSLLRLFKLVSVLVLHSRWVLVRWMEMDWIDGTSGSGSCAYHGYESRLKKSSWLSVSISEKHGGQVSKKPPVNFGGFVESAKWGWRSDVLRSLSGPVLSTLQTLRVVASGTTKEVCLLFWRDGKNRVPYSR